MLRSSVIDSAGAVAAPGKRMALARQVIVALIAMTLLLAWTTARAAVEVGSVVFAKGAVSARDTAGSVRLLGRDSAVFREDTVSTAEQSFAVIRFTDQTKMSIRPNSEISIDQFNDAEGEEVAEFSLLKGGLRAITGAIGSRKPQNVRFKTRAASIGIRGTDLVIRDCRGDECHMDELALSDFDPLRTDCVVPVTGEPPGVYFAALDGTIVASKDQKEIDLVAPAAGYADEQEMTCMNAVPRFILHDDYLNKIDLDWEEFQFFDILGVGGDDNPVCEIL